MKNIKGPFVTSQSLQQELKWGAIGSFVLYVCSKVLMVLVSILLARYLGADGFGMYSAALALMLLLSLPASLGLPLLMLRLLPAYRDRCEWGLMRGLVLRANQAVLVLAMMIAGCGTLIIWLSAEQLGAPKTIVLCWAMVLLPLTALGALRSAIVRGLRRVVIGQLPESFIMPASFLSLFFFWEALGGRMDPAAAMAIRVIATGIAFFFGSWFLLQFLPKEVWRTPSLFKIKVWWRSAAPLLFLGGMSIVSTQTDVLMLAAIRGSESAGIYQATVRGADLVTSSFVIMIFTVQPTFSRLYADGQMKRLQQVITTSARYAFFAALPIAILLSVFAAPILGLIFGTEFQRGAAALTILCIAQTIVCGLGPGNQILVMTGHEMVAAVCMAVGAGVNVLLNAIMIPAWGLTGAAVATGLSLSLWSIAVALTIQNRLDLASTAVGRLGNGKRIGGSSE